MKLHVALFAMDRDIVDLHVPDDLVAEWIGMALADDEEHSVETVTVHRDNPARVRSSSSTSDEQAPTEPVRTTTSLIPPPSATAVRKAKCMKLSTKQKAEICHLLSEIDRSKAAETVIAAAGGELHMPLYPGRSSALSECRTVWESVVKDLVQAYGQFYTKCSSTCKEDKYSTFQMRWVRMFSTCLTIPK